MKRLFTALVIFMFIVLVPLAAQANKAEMLKNIEAELTNFLNSGDRSSRQTANYDWGVIIAYYAASSRWWKGLAILNGTSYANNIMVGVWDSNGNVTASGTFLLHSMALAVDGISNFMDSGTVPNSGYIAVFGTEFFMVDRFVGNADGGFGELQYEAIPF